MRGRVICRFLYFGLIAIWALIGCGGGGGGGNEGGGGGGQTAPAVPELLNYSVTQQWFSAPDLLRMQFAGIEFKLKSINLQGTYNLTSQFTTLNHDTGMEFSVIPYGEISELKIGVLIPHGYPVKWVGRENPTTGAFQVTLPDESLGFRQIFVEVNNILPGVNIQARNAGGSPIPGMSASLNWQHFDEVQDSEEAPMYQKIARLAYSAWQIVYKKANLAYISLDQIVVNNAALEANKSYVSTGKVFPGIGLAGKLKIDWFDANGNGELGPADNFNITFTNWWVNSPNDTTGELYNGLLTLTGYIEITNSVGGDFSFSNLSEQETEKNEIGSDVAIINGGFNLTYSW